jgi:hypothetical protein
VSRTERKSEGNDIEEERNKQNERARIHLIDPVVFETTEGLLAWQLQDFLPPSFDVRKSTKYYQRNSH